MTDEAPAIEPRPARFRLALGIATAAMLQATRPLWSDLGEFPRVPFLPVAGRLAPSVATVAFVVAFSATVAGAVLASVRWARLAQAAASAALALLIAGDQSRLQPWIYQYVLTAAAFVIAGDSGDALLFARGFLVALYVHSGLSKLDASFATGLGQVFISGALHPFGIEPSAWPERTRIALALVMPAVELAAGIGLIFRRTRRTALAAVVLIHASLIAILGPWNLDHSISVLMWNAAVLVEAVVLFGGAAAGAKQDNAPVVSRRLTTALLAVVVLMPLTERLGFWDVWPSFALYAGHTARTDVYVAEDELTGLPNGARLAATGDGPWRRVDLTAWSRRERGTPVYPQTRTHNGIAEALAGAGGRPRLVMAVHFGEADRWTGRRERTESLGPAAIRAWGERFRLNAHPTRRGTGNAN